MYEPCTVAFAPAAVNNPIVPTMKYCITRFETSELLLLYALKDGIFVVSTLPRASLKGVSNVDWEAWSTTEVARCRLCVALEAMRVVEGAAAERRELLVAVGRVWRVQLRRADDALAGAGGIVKVMEGRERGLSGMGPGGDAEVNGLRKDVVPSTKFFASVLIGQEAELPLRCM